MVRRIYVFDSGSDDAYPGRWMAKGNWVPPEHNAFGATRGEAIENLGALLRSTFPGLAWDGAMPIVEQVPPWASCPAGRAAEL